VKKHHFRMPDLFYLCALLGPVWFDL
jgi:hypothetical protein